MKRTLAAFGVSVLLLLVFLFVLGPMAVIDQLSTTNLWIFVLGLVAILVTLVCWSEALRWLLAASESQVSPWRSFFAYGAGMFGKQILPMGHASGPALMAYTFDREVSLSYNQTLAVVTVAEFLNVIASLVLAVVGVGYLLLFTPAIPELRILQLGILVFATAGSLLMAVFWYRRTVIERVVLAIAWLLQRTVGRLSPRLESAFAPDRVAIGVDRYYETVDVVMSNHRAVLVAYIFTQMGWILFAVPLYTGALAQGIRLPVGLVLFIVPASGLVTLFPLPGGLGGFEIVLAGMLVALAGLELTVAAAVVLLYRLCSYWFMVVIGGAASAYSTTTFAELAAETID